MSAPESCTVELTTGRLLYVAHTPDEVWDLWRVGRRAHELISLHRMVRPDGWPYMVNAHQLVAIYPLDEVPHNQEPQQVELVRPTALGAGLRRGWGR